MSRDHPDETGFDCNDISRSQKKRDSSALQERGEYLARLSPAVWKTLPLDPELAAALHEWRGLKSREAKRRHLQYIGRLMRELDDASRAALLEALAEKTGPLPPK